MFIPVNEYLLVEEIIEQSDIALPEGSEREKYRKGIVRAVGDMAGKDYYKEYYKDMIGKTIAFERYGPTKLEDNLFLVRPQYVLATIE